MRSRPIVTVICIVICTSVAAQTPLQSPAASRELVKELERRGLDAVAVADPAESGRFIAALYLAPSQLLVVSARHPAAEALALKLQQQQFRDVYLDLQTTPVTTGKRFIHDLGADGLVSTGRTIVDNVYEDGALTVLVRDHKLDAAAIARNDQAYGRMLKALTAVLQSPPISGGVETAGH